MSTETKKLAVVLHLIEEQPWGLMVAGDIKKVLAHHPSIQVQFADPGGDAAEQTRILDRLLDENIDALIVAPIDAAAVNAPLRRYRDAAVPVIVIDNEIDEPELCRSVILADNHRFGREVGEFFAQVMGERGDLVEILGIPTSKPTPDRSAGFREALAGRSEMRILDSCIGNWKYTDALRGFTLLLARHERIDGVFAQNDEMARAALDAAARAGREAEMLIVGIDALPSSIRLVAQARLAATFINPSPGKDAVYALLAILNGEPCMEKMLLKTWPFRSNFRVEAWQKRYRQDKA